MKNAMRLALGILILTTAWMTDEAYASCVVEAPTAYTAGAKLRDDKCDTTGARKIVSENTVATTGGGVSQGTTLFNSETTSSANTAVTVSIAAVAGTRVHLYTVDARCAAAGTSSVTVKDGVGGTTIFTTLATEVTTTRLRIQWPVGVSSTTGAGMDITLATCGVGNTGTLSVQADRF